jgi:hypothetical protein
VAQNQAAPSSMPAISRQAVEADVDVDPDAEEHPARLANRANNSLDAIFFRSGIAMQRDADIAAGEKPRLQVSRGGTAPYFVEK